MIKLTAQGKFIDTKEMERLFTQGEKYSDCIHFVLSTSNNDVDISSCIFVLRTVASDGSMTETILTKTVMNENILLMWKIPETATAVPGMLRLELIGSKGSEIIIKFKMPPIYVKDSVMGSNIPVPDVVDEKLTHMNEVLQEAAELAAQINGESGIVNEIIASRKCAMSNNTYDSLSRRLIADFEQCVDKDSMFVISENILNEAKEGWEAAIAEAIGAVESGLSEVVDIPNSTEVTA